jgi:hypothetical protein
MALTHLARGLLWGAALALTFLAVTAARAETMVVERIVPPGAILSYSEGGQVVRTLNIPEGRVRVTIEFSGGGGPGIHVGHRRKR